jgi:hypothetical protein
VRLALAAAAFLLAGCEQRTDSMVDQPARSVQAPDTDQAQQDKVETVNEFYVNAWNAPGSGHEPPPAAQPESDPSGGMPSQAELAANDGGLAARDTRAGYNQILVFNVDTGSTKGTSQSASGSGATGLTNQPGSTVTQTPTQEPRATVSGSLGFAMPGGIASPQASAAAEGGTLSGVTQDQQHRLLTAWQRGLESGNFGEYFRLIEAIFGRPASQPAP